MNILLIDATASFLDFALRCEAEGHTVRVYMAKDKHHLRYPVGDGLLTKVDDWREHMRWADLVVTSDNARLVNELEGWRKRGFPIWGSNIECTAWELERGLGQEVLERAGIPCIESHIFKNYDDAKAFVLKSGKRYVSKPTGDADKALSYVSKGPADMVFMLDYWKANQKKKVPFLLQEFVPGIEMAVGGWFGPAGFCDYFLENFEFKKLMNGEVGVNTGEMGTAMKYVTADESKLAREMLLPLVPALIRAGYTGYVDVAVIIEEKGNPCPLELTTRPGWPLFQIQQVLHPECAQWMRDSLDGKPQNFKPSDEIAVGVVVAIPDFPYTRNTRKSVSGFPVWGITAANRYNVHPAEMMLGKAPCWENGKMVERPMLVTAGDYVLICSGTADCVERASEKAYKVLKSLEIPNSPMYRTDIGKRLEKQLPELHALGYATSWEY